jgi:hypothetical protein
MRVSESPPTLGQRLISGVARGGLTKCLTRVRPSVHQLSQVNAGRGKKWHHLLIMAYSDPLFSRAEFLIIENRLLQRERRQMRAERESARRTLQLNLFKAASLRVEMVSVREELSCRRSSRPRPDRGRFRLDS